MRKEFVMRGQTESGQTEVLNFSGFKPGMAYRITEFTLYSSEPNTTYELNGSITAGKAAVSPSTGLNFNNEGLIATCFLAANSNNFYAHGPVSVVNHDFLITQNLILMVEDNVGGNPVNWQCRFEADKMSGPQEAVTNYKQFAISDE